MGDINLLKYKAVKDHQTNAKKEDAYLDEKKKASDDKQAILDKQSMKCLVVPLSINGPAGTGKSYIANASSIIVDRVRERAHHEGQTQWSNFITLSKIWRRALSEI